MAIQTVQFAQAVLDRNESILFEALDGLDVEALHRQPGPDSNPTGGLMWHTPRVQDNHLAAMEWTEHVWMGVRWYGRFGRSEDASDRGRGHTSDQVREFRSPGVDVQLAYYKAVRARTDAFLETVSAEDLDRQVPNVAGDGTVPMRVRLEMTVVDNIQHSGQIAYLRGLLEGKGWFAS